MIQKIPNITHRPRKNLQYESTDGLSRKTLP